MVERFQMRHVHDWICARPDEKGDWVRHSDYAQLERELAEARAELARTQAQAIALFWAGPAEALVGDIRALKAKAETLLTAEAERDRLAAKVEIVREQCVAWAGSYGKKCGEAEHLKRGLETLASTFYKGNQHQDYAKHVLDAAARASLQEGEKGE